MSPDEAETTNSHSSGVLIDLARREVFLDGEPLMLTFKEFELLAHWWRILPAPWVVRSC